MPNDAREWDDLFREDRAYPAECENKNIRTHLARAMKYPVYGKGLIVGGAKDKPSLSLYPYLGPVADHYSQASPKTFDLVAYNILWGLYEARLFSPYPNEHRLRGIIDWLWFPHAFCRTPNFQTELGSFESMLVQLWEDLCFHGDYDLYRHSLSTYERYASQYEDPQFAISIAAKLVNIATHNADYSRAVKLASGVREVIERERKQNSEDTAYVRWLSDMLMTVNRRERSAQFFTLSVDQMPAHLAKMQDLISDIEAHKSSLSNQCLVDQKRRAHRSILRLWCYYAVHSIALGLRPADLPNMEVLCESFLKLVAQYDPKVSLIERGLDQDTMARVVCLNDVERIRSEGDVNKARKCLEIASKWVIEAYSLFMAARRVSRKLAVYAKGNASLSPLLEGLDLSIATFGDQYELWSDISRALIDRTSARLGALAHDANKDATEKDYSNAGHHISVLRSGVDPKKLRHGSFQVTTLMVLMQNELLSYTEMN